jgi:ferritin-like metal-binding protein YciE
MTTPREQLLASLRDTHAMESHAETMLKSQAGRIENYPELKARIEQHIQETQAQARQVAECLERLGESTSALKDAGGSVMAWGQALGGMVAGDEVLKGMMASYAFEHFEIAAYRQLIQIAQTAGEPDVAAVAQRILPEEEAMASWLEQHMAGITQQFMVRLQTPDAEAKR